MQRKWRASSARATACDRGYCALAVLLLPRRRPSFPTYCGRPGRRRPVALDAPAIPVTVAGVLFNVPPAAIRAAGAASSRRARAASIWCFFGPRSRRLQPTATPPSRSSRADERCRAGADAPTTALFVTIARLGAVLAPPRGCARSIRVTSRRRPPPVRTDLPSCRSAPARPTRAKTWSISPKSPSSFSPAARGRSAPCPGTCIHERSLDAAEITLRFPREWLQDWRNVAAGFDRLIAQVHRSKLIASDRRREVQSRSLPRIAIWKLYERSSSSSSTNSTPTNSSPT